MELRIILLGLVAAVWSDEAPVWKGPADCAKIVPSSKDENGADYWSITGGCDDSSRDGLEKIDTCNKAFTTISKTSTEYVLQSCKHNKKDKKCKRESIVKCTKAPVWEGPADCAKIVPSSDSKDGADYWSITGGCRDSSRNGGKKKDTCNKAFTTISETSTEYVLQSCKHDKKGKKCKSESSVKCTKAAESPAPAPAPAPAPDTNAPVTTPSAAPVTTPSAAPVEAGPSGGKCEISPLAGAALSSFTVSTSGWASAAGSLEYSFIIYETGQPKPQGASSAASCSESICEKVFRFQKNDADSKNLILPPGNWTVSCTAHDSDGMTDREGAGSARVASMPSM